MAISRGEKGIKEDIRLADTDKAPEYKYLELLDDNAARAFPEYDSEAQILNKQIDNPSVCNIAVVAKYGAGKSSTINTYLSKYRNKNNSNPSRNKYTRVTLSTFNNTKYEEAAIERSILQQLLYSRKKSKLPNSEIKRTNRTSVISSLGLCFLITFFIVSSVLFGIEVGGKLLFNAEWSKYIFLATSTVLLFLITLVIIHYRKLARIKYKDFEADIQAEGDKQSHTANLINKFVDEVLYFFECVDIDLVIFEDLDRLPTTDIFVKLHELNTIINGSRRRKGKVTFLYAVKDDLFKTEKERAKFFEFILPVVPVINPVTTEEVLREKLKKITDINEKMNLDDKFIKGISPYISDMRVLKNTFNDYIIMFNKIFEDTKADKGLRTDMLFALCMYKNLFPYDYSLLEINKGLIPTIINIKELRERASKDIEEQIAQIKIRIEELKVEKINSFEELRCMFIGQAMSMPIGEYVSSYNNHRTGKTIRPKEIQTFENLDMKMILRPSDENYYLLERSAGNEILTPSGEHYFDREKVIREKSDNGIEKANDKIAALESEKQAILGLTFAQIVEKFNVDFCCQSWLIERYAKKFNESLSVSDEEKIFPEKSIQQQIKFLRFLVANDYIDEHYLEYTSNYKAQLITQKDIGLVMSIQRRDQDFDCVPDDLRGVIGRLEEDDFKYPAILNKEFLHNLELIGQISKKEKSKKYDNFVKLLSNVKENKVFDALQEYLATSAIKQCEALLKIVVPVRPALCAEVLDSDNLTAEKRDLVFICTIRYAKNYNDANLDNKITTFLNTNKEYLMLFSSVGDTKLVLKFIEKVAPRFKSLSRAKLNGEIQRYIIGNNRYDLNLENLEVIFGITSVENESTDFYTKNYDFISNSDKQEVIEYINSNLGDYAKAVLLDPRITFNREPADKITTLLKDDTVDVETKKGIIAKSKVKLENIAEFSAQLFRDLLDNDSIDPTWENILFAFDKKGFEFVKLYLINHKKISGKFVNKDEEANIQEEFIKALVKGVTSGEIEEILRTMPASCSIELIKEASDDVMAVFISSGKVEFNNTDLTNIYAKHESLCAYLKKYEDKIMEEFDSFFDCAFPKVSQYYSGRKTYSSKENANGIISAVLSCTEINLTMKQQLVDRCQPIIKIAGYEQIYADYIINNSTALPPVILWQFTETGISSNEKLSILEYCNYGGTDIDKREIIEFLLSCGQPYISLFIDNIIVYMEKNDTTGKLLDALEKYEIVDYTELPKKNKYEVKAK